MSSLTDRFPGITLTKRTGNTRVWRQRPIAHLFANHRTVAEVDAVQLVSGRNAIFVPEGRTQDGAEGRSLSPALGAHNFQTVDHGEPNAAAQQ